jgi:hypothetical protein
MLCLYRLDYIGFDFDCNAGWLRRVELIHARTIGSNTSDRHFASEDVVSVQIRRIRFIRGLCGTSKPILPESHRPRMKRIRRICTDFWPI